MKKIFGLVFLMLILVSATFINSNEPDAMHTMEGTWELQSFYLFDGKNITDTVPIQDGYRQIKMYYNDKIMWSRTNPNDTIGRFGFGTYVITDNELIETIEYGDYQMMQALDTVRNFKFELWLTDKLYSQITVDEEGYRTTSENYKRID